MSKTIVFKTTCTYILFWCLQQIPKLKLARLQNYPLLTTFHDTFIGIFIVIMYTVGACKCNEVNATYTPGHFYKQLQYQDLYMALYLYRTV